MSLNHKDLIFCCKEVLDTFNPASRSPEGHVNSYLKHRAFEEADQTFVVEVFSGCARYSALLQVVTDGFFNRDGKRCLRSEVNFYSIYTYLALFRLEELGAAHFRKFVKCQDVNKMYKFLNFFLDEKKLRTWMKDEWNKLYDYSFIQTTVLSPIVSWLPEMQDLIQSMKDQIDNKKEVRKKSAKSTEPQPFNLTKPRPRSIPMPEPIPKLQKLQPVPESTYQKPKEVDVMDRIREENRRKAEERLMEASKTQYACANPGISDKTWQRMNEILEEEEAKLQFDKHRCNPVPQSVLSDNLPVKLNTATILREAQLYQKREKEIIKKLEKLEAGERDDTEFLEWQTSMRKRDLEGQLAEIERRRLEGKLSLEEAILAKRGLMVENKQKVQQMKQQAAELMQKYMEKRLQEEEETRKLVEGVQESHENAKDAKKKIQEYKAKIVQDIAEESRELMRQALEEAEKEMRQRMELIHQIRAMEAVPVIRHKLVDITTTAGHGLLSEMSIAELRERHALLKVSQREDEETRRDDILAAKEVKTQMLMDTLESITKHRTEQSRAAAVRLEDSKRKRTYKPEIKDEKVLDLQKKLEEKRAERLREQEKSKITPSKKSTKRLQELGASKRALEESRWAELERRRERTALLASQGEGRQTSKLHSRTVIATT